MNDWALIPNERSVELPWLVDQTIAFPALDVGCNESVYLRHYQDAMTPLDGIDVRPQSRGGLNTFYQADIRTWDAPQKYGTVIALSTIEHIGLHVDGYGTSADDVEDGDRKAIEGCMRALRPGGTLLLTVPYGKDENRGWYRIYSKVGLERLLAGYEWDADYHLNDSWDVGGVALIKVWHRD